ncbi:hypothetical protein DW656_13565 [Coprococcus comes]|uniref:Alternate signal-mediated exported protein, CPF_0494 family n=2 Tax=Coprococcus comes TaxID=410072 RepID=A0A3R6D295_9FIRM|nr:hypothetical protein DW656_13565 [Coprococcus comes]
MRMKKKKKSFPKKPALILTAAALLLVGSTVGSTRAALTYYSENYSAQMNMQSIGVSLLENDKVVSSRDYVSNNEWKGTSEGELLTDLLGKDDTFTPGKKYNEAINVKNSGTIDTFVRVIITKSWQDKEGKKNTTLSPDLIELNFLTDNGWQIAKDQSTTERTVLYYTKAVATGDSTPALSDTIRINPSIAKDVTKHVDGYTITYTYKYDGYTFHVDAEVDAVQTHNAKDAIKSAWGVDVNVSDDETTMSLQ